MTTFLQHIIQAAANPEINSVQTGEATIPSSGTSVNATITAVTVNKSFLIFTFESSDGFSQNQRNLAQGWINSTTQLTFQRSSNPASTIIIRWYVVEFSATSSATVQHFNNQLAAGATENKTLTAVNLSNSFPIVSCQDSEAGWNVGGYPTAEITTTTNVQIAWGAINTTRYTVQVIENPNWTVTKYTHSLLTTDSGNTDKTITAVILAETMLIGSARGASDFNPNAHKYWKWGLLNTTTIRYYRDTDTDQAWNTVLYVIEGGGEFIARHSELNTMAAAATVDNVSITALTDFTKAIVINGGADKGTGAGQNSVDDDGDERMLKLHLTSNTNVQANRGTTTAADMLYSFNAVDFSPST